MKTFEDLPTAHETAQDFFYSQRANMAPHVADAMKPLFAMGASPIVALVHFAEIVFANPDGFGTVQKAADAAGASVAAFVDREGWHNDGALKGRSKAISLALRRRSGEKAPDGSSWPDKADDPEARADFLEPAKAEDEAAAPGTAP